MVTYMHYDLRISPGHEQYKVRRLFCDGDYCEWPVCDLLIPKPRDFHVRVLNIADDLDNLRTESKYGP